MVFDLNDALWGLVGGLMIGVAAATMLLGVGRIAGISGFLGEALTGGSGGRRNETLGFLAGLILAPALAALAGFAPAVGVLAEPLPIVLGGLLVGFGTGLGSGCTSGHGVCGLSRFSPRSLAATLTFLVVGIGTASLLRPALLGWLEGG